MLIPLAISILTSMPLPLPRFFLLQPPIAIAITIAIAKLFSLTATNHITIAIANHIPIYNRKANKKATVKWPF